MAGVEIPGKSRRAAPSVIFCSFAVVAIIYASHIRSKAAEASTNYELVFSLPSGWKSKPITPGMAFVYENDTSHLSMRGAVNNVVSEVNPTPELNAEAIIKQYQHITKDNLVGWQCKVLEPVEGRDAQFRLIRRWTHDRCVVSAVAVRGNTTIIIALIGHDESLPRVDEGMPAFRDYLASLALERHTYAD